MKRKFELIYENEVQHIEVKSKLPFGITEAKKWLKNKHPEVKSIRTIK